MSKPTLKGYPGFLDKVRHRALQLLDIALITLNDYKRLVSLTAIVIMMVRQVIKACDSKKIRCAVLQIVKSSKKARALGHFFAL